MNNNLHINQNKKSGYTVFDVTGNKIDQSNLAFLKKSIVPSFEKDQTYLFNLQTISHMDSHGMALFVHFLHDLEKINSKMMLIHLHPSVQSLLELTQLVNLFEIYDTEEQAHSVLMAL